MYSKTDHIPIIEEIARGLYMSGHNQAYLELGIAKAKCFNCIAPYFKSSVAVDIREGVLKYINIKPDVFCHEGTDKFFKSNTCKFLGIDGFNLIFIDADHSYKQVEKDFVNSWNALAENGFVILHDTYSPSEKYDKHCQDSYKIEEFLKSGNYEFLTIPFFFGLTIVKKGFSVVC